MIFKNITFILILISISLLIVPFIDFNDNKFASAKSDDDDDDKEEDDEEENKNYKKKSRDKDKDTQDEKEDQQQGDDEKDNDKKTKKSKKNKNKKEFDNYSEASYDRTLTDNRENDAYDIFGIKEIYPTSLDGEEWFLDMEDPVADPQFSPFNMNTKATDPNFKLTQNEDGSWKLKSKNSEAKVRMDVFTTDGYHPESIETFDHTELAKKGFMQSEKDWKNVEITGYIKLNHRTIPLDEGKFTWYNRGGHHSASNPCEGVGYKGSIYFSGDLKFSKEQWHVSYFFTDIEKGIDSLEDRWIGYKFISYNIPDPDESSDTLVKIESWVDMDNDGNWIKMDEYIDDGKWGKSGKRCDGEKDQIITWGGPIATFRWDRADDVDFMDLSVREIEPPYI
ncbi:MAG: hypothetical protein MRJ93_14175 [Nitrososphaeraceae archaeon]|nr:hypothetical protein [Nitrososphaeraceae archaeon]